MTEENKFSVTRHFDSAKAQSYDEQIRLVIPGYEAMHEMSLALLRDRLPETARILVVGGGAGKEVVSYALAQPGWTISGVDPSDAMLDIARRRIAEYAVEDRVQLHANYLHDLGNDVFDAVTSILVMQFTPDDGGKSEFLDQVSRRLKRGGQFVLVDLVGDADGPDFGRLMSAWRTHQLTVGRDVEDVEDMFSHVREHIHFISESRIRELLTCSGFDQIQKFHQSFLFSGWVARKA